MIRSMTALAAAALIVAACTPAEDSTAADTAAEAPAAPTAADVTPASVRAMIEADGAQPTVAALWNANDGAAWDVVAAGVESGEQAWLDIVPLIEPGTENATAHDLAYGLSQALLTHPAGVLAAAGGGDGHCVNAEVEFAEDAALIAQSNAAYYPAAIAAVEGVNDPALAEAREMCLTSLRAGQSAAG
jgi:hypothetical protein